MLPGLPTPPVHPPAIPTGVDRLATGLRRALALLPGLALALLLLLPLSACSGVGQPPQKVLLSALGLQIQLTQQAIATSLALEPVGAPQVSRVRVESQQAMAIGAGRGLHLTGRFDWRLPSDPIRVDSRFDLYLQRGERGQSWRLARPVGSADGSNQDWLIDPLPLPGERA